MRMSKDLARLVASSGATYAAPFHNLTPRSMFVAGRIPLGFDEAVNASLLGHTVEARVAFCPAEPLGVVLTFEATPELEAAIRAFRGDAVDDWDDQDVTGTHDAEAAALVGQMLARVEVTDPEVEESSEDPTNLGARALADLEDEVTPPSLPAVHARDQAREASAGLRQSAGQPSEGKGTRLRATTQVSGAADEPDDG